MLPGAGMGGRLERLWVDAGLSVDLQEGNRLTLLGDVGGPRLAFLPETSAPIRGVSGTPVSFRSGIGSQQKTSHLSQG